MKIGIIGFGKMGMLHAGIVNALEGHEVVAIAEPSGMISSAMGVLQPRIRMFDDHRRLLDEAKPDAVFITTPVHLHMDQAKDCIERGVPFFLEKPMALTAEQAAPAVAALARRPVVNLVGWMMRYIETFRRGKEVVDSGCLGRIISFSATMYISQLFKAGKGWRYDKSKSGGGVIMGPCSHTIDLLFHYFGLPAGVNAFQIRNYSKETEDFIHVMYTMENGLRGWLDSSWSVRGHRLVETRILVHGENGMLDVSDDALRLLLDKEHELYPEGWTITPKTEFFTGVEFDVGGQQYTAEDREFLSAVSEGRQVSNDIRAGRDVHRIIDAIYDSAGSNGDFRRLET